MEYLRCLLFVGLLGDRPQKTFIEFPRNIFFHKSNFLESAKTYKTMPGLGLQKLPTSPPIELFCDFMCARFDHIHGLAIVRAK
jgi:hypothetical protein